MNSHQRTTTYGRLSRKTNYDFKYSAPEQPLLTILAKNQDVIQEEDHISAKILVPSPNALDVNNSSNNLRTIRCTRSMTRPPHETELESEHSAYEKKSSCDMLPSKSEGFGKFGPSRKISEKKGSLERNSGVEEATIVYDDQNLQCRIAAESLSDGKKISAFGAISQNKNILKKKRPSSSEALQNNHQDQYLQGPSASSHRRELKTKGFEPLELVSSELRVHHRLPAAERNQKQKVADRGMYAHQMRRSKGNSSSTEIGSTNTFQNHSKGSPPNYLCSMSPSPSAIDEKNSKNISLHQGPIPLPGASTTHQRELWDMLLKDDAERQSPLTPEPPSIMSAHRADISKSRSEDQRERGSHGTLYNKGRKRRRLVDHLNSCETDRYKSDDALIDQDTSDKGSGGDTTINTSSVAAKSSLCESRALITPSQDRIHNAANLGKPSMPLQSGRLKVTYARQRSFVDDDAPGAMVDVAISTEPPQLQTKWQSAESVIQIKSDESLEETVNSQGSMMRSIYELRKAGSNARAVCNMEALLDDIKGETGLSLECKVSRLLELIAKLQDIPYCRLFIGQGLDLRLLACLDLDNDMALKALIAAAILHLLVPSTCLSKLHQTKDPRLSKLLLELLDQEGNLKILVKKVGFMKPGIQRADFETSWENLLKSTAWGRLRPVVVTARVIGLQCLEYLARHVHKSSQPAAAIPPHVFWSVARILDPSFSVSVRKPNPRSQLDLQLALSVLEIYTIGDSSVIEESIWKGETLGYLKSFLPRLSTWREEEIGKLRTLTLRLYLNLMNNRPKLCEAFATTDVIGSLLIIIVSNFRRLAQDRCDDAKLLLDNLILALGSMINLAEWCHTAPQIVMNLRLEDASSLDILLELYTSKQVEAQEVFSEKEATINVAFGYLSVLISYLCIDEMTRDKVSSSLQGKTLKQLLDSVEEFMHYHTQVDDVPQGGLDFDDKTNFLHRLHSVINDLKTNRR